MKKTIVIFILVGLIFSGSFRLVSATIESVDPVSFPNPLGSTTTAEGLVANVIEGLEAIVVSLAIVFVVVGGIMYMLSFGNEQNMERAKKVITASMIGLAVVVSARTFLQEIWNILGSGSGVASPGGLELSDIVENVLDLVLSLIGVIAIISMIIGGGMYLTSYGDTDKTERGKKILVGSIIGLVIALGSLILVKQIVNLIQ